MKTLYLFLFSLSCVLLLNNTSYGQSYCNYDELISVDHSVGEDTPFKLLVQEDGKIMVVGTTYYGLDNNFKASVARLDENLQSLDLSFGNEGKVQHTWDSRNTAISATLQQDNKILLGGYQAPSNAFSTFRPYIARLNNDGSPDESWGELGSSSFGTESPTDGRGAVVGMKEFEDGSVRALFIGSNPGICGVAQLDENGNLDTLFSEDGIHSVELPLLYWQTDYGKGLFLEDSSMLVISKSFNSITRPMIIKLNPNGSLDSTFATNGTLYIDFGIQYNYAGIHAELDSEENLIVAATQGDSGSHKYVVFKINSETGILDASFGEEGIAQSIISSISNAAHELIIDPSNGDIYVLGTGGDGGAENAIWRINSLGEEIDNCGNTGYYQPTVQYHWGFWAAEFDTEGDMIIAGRGSTVDTTSGPNQGSNIVFPRAFFDVNVEEHTETDFSVYPNPANDLINVKLNSKDSYSHIQISNHLGQIIYQSTDLHSTINVSELAKGLYNVRLSGKSGLSSQRLILN